MTILQIAHMAALMAGLSSVSLLDQYRRTRRRDLLALAVLSAGAMLSSLPGMGG